MTTIQTAISPIQTATAAQKEKYRTCCLQFGERIQKVEVTDGDLLVHYLTEQGAKIIARYGKEGHYIGASMRVR